MKRITAGDLNRRVTLLTPAAGSSPDGQPLTTWQAAGQIWAKVRHLAGIEAVQAGAVASTVRAVITVRSRAEGFDADMRVQHGAMLYDVKAVLPHGAQPGFTELHCEILPS